MPKGVCVLCKHFAKSKGLPTPSVVKPVVVKTYESLGTLPCYDMVVEMGKMYPEVKVAEGQTICSSHVIPLPQDKKRYSNFFRPYLKKEGNGLAITFPPLSRKRVAREPLPCKPVKKKRETLVRENKLQAVELRDMEEMMREKEEKLRVQEEELKVLKEWAKVAKKEEDKVKEESEKKEEELRMLKEKVVCLKRGLSQAPLDIALAKKTKDHQWYGVTDFQHFYLQILPFFQINRDPLTMSEEDLGSKKRRLERFLIYLRQGFNQKIAISLMEPDLHRTTFQRRFKDTLEVVYKWALPKIKLPVASEWKRRNAANRDKLDKSFPGFLFFFIDGTVLEVFSAQDVSKNRENFNAKHGKNAYTYFIMCAPDGYITYLSLVDTGSTHDSTSWNTALAYPPVEIDPVSGISKNRSDKRSLIQDLEEHYGIGKPEGEKVNEFDTETKTPGPGDDLKGQCTFSISGDKAYPYILLPRGWSLHVTMTAGEESAHKEAVEGNEATTQKFQEANLVPPKLIHTISGDERRHRSPLIAKARSVVERVIGAMKLWLLLCNVPYISKQQLSVVFQLLVVVAALCNYNLEQRGTVW
jgi:hypothetical protein